MAFRSAARILGRVALVGGGAAAAAVGVALSASHGDKHPPPKTLPELSETVPTRATQWAALSGSSESNPFDILVVGGGATGAGIALDAATRGLRVALVEREDFSSGSSSKSTKLLHGGVRYLEKAVLNRDPRQLSLVLEALSERATVLRNAPHLSWPLPTLTPCYSFTELPYFWAGLKAYDLLAGRKMLHLSRFVSASEARMIFPTLKETTSDGQILRGGVVYFDGQMDDSRLNVAIATTAARAGAAVVNHAEVKGLILEDDLEGFLAEEEDSSRILQKVRGAVVEDKLTGRKVEVAAKVVVNATGVYCDSMRHLANKSASKKVIASSGAHLVLPEYIAPGNNSFPGRSGTGLIIPKTSDGRVMFVLPWLGRTIVGTTDEKAAVVDNPVATDEEVSFILETLGKYLSLEVGIHDVSSAWSGLRPLVIGPDESEEASGKEEHGSEGSGERRGGKGTQGIVRDHVIEIGEEGLVTVTGGKWTTYRNMAEQTVDAAISSAHLSPTRRCLTEHLPLTGAENYSPSIFGSLVHLRLLVKDESSRRVELRQVDPEVACHLAQSYGTRAFDVADIARMEAKGARIVPSFPILEAEVLFCVRNEYCETAVDFLARRSRLAFLDASAALQALPKVVDLMAAEHKWSGSRRKEELRAGEKFLKGFVPSRK